MKIICFDTETTGLIPRPKPMIFAKDKWPYILQLSYIVYDTDSKNYIFENDYIKLEDYSVITEESYNIHKIDKIFLQQNGKNINEVLIKFNTYLKDSQIVLGHNLQFDKDMIIIECYRNKVFHYFNNNMLKIKEYCTMKQGINICKIEKTNSAGEIYYKWPKLKELYLELFKKEPDESLLHNAFYDVYYTLKCYFKIEYDEILNLKF